jgi:hypothetical protein
MTPVCDSAIYIVHLNTVECKQFLPILFQPAHHFQASAKSLATSRNAFLSDARSAFSAAP